jgi:hypothetical protein
MNFGKDKWTSRKRLLSLLGSPRIHREAFQIIQQIPEVFQTSSGGLKHMIYKWILYFISKMVGKPQGNNTFWQQLSKTIEKV